VQTDAQGNFSLPNPGGVSNVSIKITDPNAENPALTMRYINHWKGPVEVPAYTKDVDAATMGTLTIIPGCDVDLAALVCKLNDATLQVRDQQLNDTKIIPIANGISIESGADNNIGLMVGFLTLPFVSDQVPDPFIFNYFDIIGNRFFDDAGKNNYSSSQDGVMLTNNGRYKQIFSPLTFHPGVVENAGVGDSHTGLDMIVDVGNYALSGIPNSEVYTVSPETDSEIRINIWFKEPIFNQNYESGGGHLSIRFSNVGDTLYRGQIFGLTGNSGEYSGEFPQIHFGIGKRVTEEWLYVDPFRTIITLDPLPANYWGSKVSWWSSDNLPQFSR
jgi:hypothetical protein